MLDLDSIIEIKNAYDENQIIDYVTEHTEIEDEEFLLTIRKILWNEEEIEEDFSYVPYLFMAFGAFQQGKLEEGELKVFLSRGYGLGKIDGDDLTSLLFIYLDHNENLSTYIQNLKENARELGCNTLDLKRLLQLYSRYFDKPMPKKFDTILSRIKSINSRPEYISEITSNTETSDLIELSNWVDWKYSLEFVNSALDRKTEDITSESYEEALAEMRNDEILADFPLSTEVFDDTMSNFQPSTVDMELMEKLPEENAKELLPKFVYSSPDLEEKIKVYFPGGRHIGHSAILVKTNHSLFLMDFGMSVVNSSLPRWMPSLSKLDAILVSHAHLDHSGGLPLLYSGEKDIPWYGIKETKIMSGMLWQDTRKIVNRNYRKDILEENYQLSQLSSKPNIINALSKFNELNYGEEQIILPNISVIPHKAGHLFGSAGFELKIGGKRLLYTGDFNLDGTTTLSGAEFPTDSDLTIFDGTYLGRYKDHKPAKPTLQSLIDNHDRILIPAFSMGRTQEMLFKLKSLNAQESHSIYLTGMGGKLARKLHMNVGASGGGVQGGVSIVPTVNEEDFEGKSIVIAGQGMLQVGTSRRLLDHTKDDENTAVVLCGYQAPNTLGYHILNGNEYLQGIYNQKFTRVSMSGHSSAKSLDKFLGNLTNRKLVVHTPKGAYEDYSDDDILRPNGFKPITM